MTVYINRKDSQYRETVDEFTTRKEASVALREYQLSDRSAEYYFSTRACKGWNKG